MKEVKISLVCIPTIHNYYITKGTKYPIFSVKKIAIVGSKK